ncbi:MAG: septum site-determining protein MinC [Lachnospiraceae bacterium]
MRETVVIKGSKTGLSVFLDPDAGFEKILQDLEDKFRESAKFWGSVQMALTLEGRKLTAEEEFQVVNTITSNSQIEILCLIDTDADRIERSEKALNDRLMELASRTGQFYKGSLHRGESLESEASVVIIGDVERGAKVISKGNVIVLGELRGNAFAGVSGNESAVIAALVMAPTQIKIADCAGYFGEKGKKLGRSPILLSVVEKRIQIQPMKKNFLSKINFMN